MTSDLWPAPRSDAPLDADVRVPGSKSITNRALVLGALADSPLQLRGPLVSRDTSLMAEAVRALGASVDKSWLVTPAALRGDVAIDVGLAGTVMRFLPPVAALASGPVRFDGDPRARERPLRPLVDALRSLGARVDGDRLPLTVHGTGRVSGGAVEIDAAASSQLVSGLLLAAARYDDGLVVRHRGERLPSGPLIDLTVAMLRDRGVTVEVSGADEWHVLPDPIRGGVVDVEPDLSTAAAFVAAPLVAGGRVTVMGWPSTSVQPGARTPDVLAAMGAEVVLDDRGLTVTGTGEVRGINVDLADNSELACVLAAVACCASTPSRLTGIAHMRGHETDRLAALAKELSALGASVTELPDGLAITPGPLTGGVFQTYDDHRLAMAAAVLGLTVPGVLVENVGTTGKTFPGFADAWIAMVSP